MLTVEAPSYTVRGITIFRDHADPNHYWYLPSSRVRVSDGGRGLAFVAYSEDISTDPDFEVGEARAGGFLTLEVELGPGITELAAIRDALVEQVDNSDLRLAQAPFTDGSATLYILGSRGDGGGDLGADGFEVQVVGSSKPSLYGRQTAVFSARLGGKAAEILYTTLRQTSDPQAVVAYELKFKALEPAYNLEIEVDFKKTFEQIRHRIGVNLLVAKADMDFLIQEAINEGTIVVKEIDFTGDSSASSPLAAEGGVLKLVRDLISPTLFNPMPIPTPSYRALPDSATAALVGETASSSNSIQLAGSGGGAEEPRTIEVGEEDLKLEHSPISGGQEAGTAVPVSVSVEAGDGVSDVAVSLFYRPEGDDDFVEAAMRPGAGPGAGNGDDDDEDDDGGESDGEDGDEEDDGEDDEEDDDEDDEEDEDEEDEDEEDEDEEDEDEEDDGDDEEDDDENGDADTGSWSASIPAQTSGTTVEYYLLATGRKEGEEIRQTLPEDGDEEPLSFTVGRRDSRTRTYKKVADLQATTLLGYSLRSIESVEQIKRTFKLDRQMAVIRSYYPGGVLSANNIGPLFDATEQVTHVQLGQGPFRVIELKFRAGFDFDRHHVLSAVVDVTYGRRADDSEAPLHRLTATLTKDQPVAQLQFFADRQGTQSYDYRVTFVFDPDYLVGDVDAEDGVRSQLFTEEHSRDVSVELDRHSPVIPVTVRTGYLNFDAQVLRQVQVRVAPAQTAEGRTVILAASADQGHVNVLPAEGTDGYVMRQRFIFRDDAIDIEMTGWRDTEVFINEPDGVVYRMRPQFLDPYGLVDRVFVDALYEHQDDEEERATLLLSEAAPSSEFAVVLRPDDPHSWSAVYRFVMKEGQPIVGPRLDFEVPQPFVHLSAALLRVVRVELLDPSIFETSEVLAVRTVLGADLTEPNLATSTVLLRRGTTTKSIVVAGVSLGEPVQARIEVIRQGAPPEATSASLAASEDTLYLHF